MLLTKNSIRDLGTRISEANGSKISSFAQNYMKKLGWEEGKGLGKDESGMQSHIKVAKKDEPTGLGLDKAAVESVQANENWWQDAFSSNLKSFTSNNKKAKKSSSKKRKNEEEDLEGNADAPSFDDLFRATGGARLGMRARASQNGKFKRTEHLEEVKVLSLRADTQTPTTVLSTNSDEDARTDTDSNTDGGISTTTTTTTRATKADDRDGEEDNDDDNADENEKRRAKKAKKEKRSKKESAEVAEVDGEDNGEANEEEEIEKKQSKKSKKHKKDKK